MHIITVYIVATHTSNILNSKAVANEHSNIVQDLKLLQSNISLWTER